MLCINGRKLKEADFDFEDLDGFIEAFGKEFHESSDRLKQHGVVHLSSAKQCLYVCQREIAVVPPSDGINYLGSDMATTCHIVVVRCPETKISAVAHFDGSSMLEGVQEILVSIKTMLKLSGAKPEWKRFDERFLAELDLHIVGGFDDEKGYSRNLTIELLALFHTAPVDGIRLNLRTFCCTPFNTRLQHKGQHIIKAPILLGLAVKIDSGKIFPAVFDQYAKQPELAMRSAMSLHGQLGMTSIYNWKEHRVEIHPFTFERFRLAEKLLQQSDDYILKRMSTSPDVEPSNFVDEMRQALAFIVRHPHPLNTVFADGNSIKYRMAGGGKWERVE